MEFEEFLNTYNYPIDNKIDSDGLNDKKGANSQNCSISTQPDLLKKMLLLKGSEQKELFSTARKIRDEYFEKKMFIRASLEFSNYCVNNCSFCGMSHNNKKLQRYNMTPDEMKRVIDNVLKMDIGQLHLVAGEYDKHNIDDLCDVIEYASDNGMQTTVVIGKREPEDYRKIYDAGARRYILKFETSNEDLFYKYKSQKTLSDHLFQLGILRDIGFKIGTGAIIGLPGTTLEDILNDLLLIRQIKPDMASASVFSPNEDSQLAHHKPGDSNIVLNFIALIRLVSTEYQPMIPSSSSLCNDGQYMGLNAGANVISYHATPEDYIDGFSTYRAKERIKVKLEMINKIADRAGMEIARYE